MRAPYRQIAERDVLGNRQGRHQAQLLRDGHNACGDGVMRTGEVTFLTRDAQCTAVGTMHAAQNPDQRRLAGAILPDDGVDLAEAHIEIDAVESERGAEPFAHAFETRRGNGHARFHPPSFRGAGKAREPGIHNHQKR